MAFRERIELLIDVSTGKASSAIGKLRGDLAQAEGSFGKAKVASSALWDGLKANAGTAALAAGSALVGFAAKSVGEFQKAALGAGKLRDALGVTAEEASQLQEVAGDLSIPLGAVESSIGRMNKTAAASPEAFDAIGASIERNRDGTMDVIGTFESAAEAINKIPDAGKRAEAAQKIFGKGWRDIAQLIRGGADGVRKALESVEDAKIFDDQDIKDGEELRDRFDELKGKVESVTLELGRGLVPILSDVADMAIVAAEGVTTLNDALSVGGEHGFSPWKTGAGIVEDLGFHFGVLRDTVHDFVPEITASVDQVAVAAYKTGESFEVMGQSIYLAGEKSTETTTAMDIIAGAIDDAKVATDEAALALQRNTEQLDRNRDAAYEAADAVFDLETHEIRLMDAVDAATLAHEAAEVAVDDTKTAVDEKAAAVRAARDADISAATEAWETSKAYAAEQGASEGSAEAAQLQREYLRRLQQAIPGLRDEIQRYIDKLNAIPTTRTTTLIIRQARGPGQGEPGNPGGGGGGGYGDPLMSSGGMGGVTAGGTGGPWTPGRTRTGGDYRTPAGSAATGGTFGGTVIINAPIVDARTVERLRRQYTRRNG